MTLLEKIQFDRQSAASTQQLINCSDHHIPVTLFCQECQVTCCSTCIFDDKHNAHQNKIKTINSLATQAKEQITSIMEEAKEMDKQLQLDYEKLEQQQTGRI